MIKSGKIEIPVTAKVTCTIKLLAVGKELGEP